jgi:hypothetical protein
MARAGARRDAPDPHVIPSGMRGVMFIWLALDEGTPVPDVLRHRVSFELSTATGPEAGAIEGGAIAVRRETPIALDPPLRGGPWVAIYDPSSVGGHRRAIFAIDGRARIPARFAVDWVKLSDDTHGYGADVLAVSDATVADAVDRFLEPTVPLTLDNAAGNHVTLDLGAGRFAFYEHLRPGSIRVMVGQAVRSGEVLASLGASGSVSSGPHLHFHVGDTNSTLGSEGLPTCSSVSTFWVRSDRWTRLPKEKPGCRLQAVDAWSCRRSKPLCDSDPRAPRRPEGLHYVHLERAQGAVGFDRAGTTFSVMCIDEGRAVAAAAFGDEVKAADSMSGS